MFSRSFLVLIIFLFHQNIFAQRFVYVDTEYILERLPDYQKAQDQLNNIINDWRNEIEEKNAEIDKLRKAFQAEQVLLTEEMKQEKLAEIDEKEKSVLELNKQRFGYQGELFQKKQELIKPVQDKVYKEIQAMAEAKVYDFVFDKSSGVSMLFATPKYDRSDEILKALGVTNTALPKSEKAPVSTKPNTAPPKTTEDSKPENNNTTKPATKDTGKPKAGAVNTKPSTTTMPDTKKP